MQQQLQDGSPDEPNDTTSVVPEKIVEVSQAKEESPARWLEDACAVFRGVLTDKLLDFQPEVRTLLADLVQDRGEGEILTRLQTPEFFPGSSLGQVEKTTVITVVIAQMWEAICTRVRNDIRELSLEKKPETPAPSDSPDGVKVDPPRLSPSEQKIALLSADLLLESLETIPLSAWLTEQLRKNGVSTVLDLLNLSQKAFNELPLSGPLWKQELRNKLSARHPGLLVLASPLHSLPGFTEERCRNVATYMKVYPLSVVDGRLMPRTDLSKIPVDNGWRLWTSDPKLPAAAELSSEEIKQLAILFESAGLRHRW